MGCGGSREQPMVRTADNEHNQRILAKKEATKTTAPSQNETKKKSEKEAVESIKAPTKPVNMVPPVPREEHKVDDSSTDTRRDKEVSSEGKGDPHGEGDKIDRLDNREISVDKQSDNDAQEDQSDDEKVRREKQSEQHSEDDKAEIEDNNIEKQSEKHEQDDNPDLKENSIEKQNEQHKQNNNPENEEVQDEKQSEEHVQENNPEINAVSVQGQESSSDITKPDNNKTEPNINDEIKNEGVHDEETSQSNEHPPSTASEPLNPDHQIQNPVAEEKTESSENTTDETTDNSKKPQIDMNTYVKLRLAAKEDQRLASLPRQSGQESETPAADQSGHQQYLTMKSNLRTFSDYEITNLPRELIQVKDWQKFITDVCSIEYIQARCSVEEASEYSAELLNAIQICDSEEYKSIIQQFIDLLQARADFLNKFPTCVLQEAVNCPDGSAPASVARAYIRDRRSDAGWLQDLTKNISYEVLNSASSQGHAVSHMTFSVDGQYLSVIMQESPNILLANTLTGNITVISGESTSLRCCAFLASKEIVAFSEGNIIIYDITSGDKLRSFDGVFSGNITCAVHLQKEENHMAVLGEEGEGTILKVIDVSDGNVIRQFDVDKLAGNPKVVLSADRSKLFTCVVRVVDDESKEYEVLALDVESGEIVFSFKPPDAHCFDLDMGNEFLAVGGSSGKVFVVDVMWKQQVVEIQPHQAAINGIGLSTSKDGWIVTASDDNLLKIVDRKSGDLLAVTGVDHTISTCVVSHQMREDSSDTIIAFGTNKGAVKVVRYSQIKEQ